MNSKEKAIELVEKYKKHVNGFVGSSMLSNTEYPETILNNAKQCALICVDEIMEIKSVYHDTDLYDYWQNVKQEIENL